ncbi:MULTISPECIES: ProQ/FINO family protein [unclassified Halomonas]|uniref:ProQ/FINO family protein n=1 Tax=unclassified Halomonas TaxID=2609666 RepID=UPI002886EA04|nr:MULTISPECIES: ProQ/FINO family protein [unclassified Halomonas]MDT0501024.1 ProQ/FINO family protein [Halomonas sp. PAR7]MDT0513215.1 ProQ/FINO family protein [Halomonas sp. LES1]MDT0593016.1 ProQ/FINO family protein [Halomonas sp. PAR8]
MAEQRVHSLLDALDGRTRSLLERLAHERGARRHAESVQGELAQRLGELERRLAEAQAAHRELAEAHRELEEAKGTLEEGRRKLEEQCRELEEECRELDEQNSELEAHNRHLHERLTSGQPAEGGFRPGRRSQGLSALIGHRPASADSSTPSSPVSRATDKSGSYQADVSETPQSSQSPDKSGSYQAAVSETLQSPMSRAADTAGSCEAGVADAARPVGARVIERNEEVSSPSEASSPQEASEPPSPQALLGEWYVRYPAAFFKGHTRPLMVGIHEVLASREPWPEKLVRRALACYVNLPRYLKAMREGAERIDLDGQPAGKVDAQAANYAHRKLDHLQGDKRSGKGRNHQNRQHQGPGKSAKGAIQAKGRPKAGSKGPEQGGTPKGRADVPDSASHESGSAAAPATMEEKLSALLAKHNGR